MNWRDRSGLSLLELLIALTFVAVIAGALASATGFGVRLLDRTQNLQDANAEIALRLRTRNWLRTAATPNPLVELPTGLRGDATQLSFTTFSTKLFAPESAALRITVSASDDQVALQIDELSDIGEILQSHLRTLASQTTNAQIGYFDKDDIAAGWQSSWTNQSRLPTLVRITADGDSVPSWPEFTVKLVLAQ